MLVIAILLVLSAVATTVALIAASPLFRSVVMAVDSWSSAYQNEVHQFR